jgi:hypothetical protein
LAINWSGARDKVRGDLWKGASGVPDDVVDRAIHSVLLDLESKRRWLWLENIRHTEALSDATAILALPGDLRSVTTLSFQRSGQSFFDPPLERISVTQARMLASGGSGGWPLSYGLSGNQAFLDSEAPAGSTFDLVYSSETPPVLEDAIAASTITTLNLHQAIIISGAAALVALGYLKDETNAGRHQAIYDKGVIRLEDRDDEQRGDTTGANIVPDTAYADAVR